MPKLTKIVATISDRRCDTDFLLELHNEGMDVVRLNTAHQNAEQALKVITNARKVSDKIALLVDTKGPEMRVTEVDAKIPFKEGEMVQFKGNKAEKSNHECLYVNFDGFVRDVPLGSRILIDDGAVSFMVTEKIDDYLLCKVENDGEVGSRKSVNVPNVHIDLPSLSPKDIEFIHFAIEHDIDFIAHSFVRYKEDVLAIQQILDEHNSQIKIIAKIENQQGVDNIDEILDHVYGVMIARGDLGIEIPAERIPMIQKAINSKCIARRKPVIVATQMLHTMIENPRPTRAEVSDVANAIFDGTDAVMLSGETASGHYPVEAVKIMAKIAMEVEKMKNEFMDVVAIKNNHPVASYLARSAVKASVQLQAAAIVSDSESGTTVRNLAAYRGRKPIYAICYNQRLMRELALSYGAFPFYMKPRKSTDEFLHKAIKLLQEKSLLMDDDLVVVVAGNFGPGTGASFVEISTTQNLLLRY